MARLLKTESLNDWQCFCSVIHKCQVKGNNGSIRHFKEYQSQVTEHLWMSQAIEFVNSCYQRESFSVHFVETEFELQI